MAKERATDTQEQQQRKQSGEEQSVARREAGSPLAALALASPFALMRRFMEDMDRLVEDFGSGNAATAPRGEGRDPIWVPPLEILQRDGQLVIRAEVPGMEKDQINVEVVDNNLVVSGERVQEHEERRERFYRSERSYGRFYRAIPLPEGAETAQARATFTNGVLEITIPTRQQASQAQRIDVQEGDGSRVTTSQPQQQAAASAG